MRKIMLLAICVFFAFLAEANPVATVLVRHHGKTTQFPADSISSAFNLAEDGDTLLLSKGTFPGFTLTKRITVRGDGQLTHVAGNINISLSDSLLSQTALEGLHVGGINSGASDVYDSDITVSSATVNLAIRQCRFSTISFSSLSNGRGHENVRIDRCHVSGDFRFRDNVRSMEVNNCYINQFYPENESSRNVSFVNCNICYTYYNWHSYISDFRGSFVNCILGGGSSQKPLQHIALIYTLMEDYPVQTSTCLTDHNYVVGGKLFNENYYPVHPCVYSDDELVEKGYLGNDGTCVGYTGGSTPFSLELAVPRVSDASVRFDNDSRVLNVEISVSPSN